MSRWWVVAGALAAGGVVAYAADVDPRGWTPGGTPAVNAAKVMAGITETVEVELPRSLRGRVRGPTVLFYFSPTCPHCRHVAREVEALHTRLEGASLLGIASGAGTPDALAEFQRTFGITFPVVHDLEQEINTAFGMRSTPVALLVEPAGRTKVRVRDGWFPYVPGFDALIEGRVSGDPFARLADGNGERYLGTDACGTCHSQEYGSWQLTHHAVAWRTLTKRDEHTNPECTGCHVTGSGAPGGWNGDEHSALVDVGCEACHGPGGPHDGVTTAPESTCATCHDAKHSIAFTTAKGVPLIDHYRVLTMDESSFREQRRALYDGNAPRALLAFAEGKNVGSASCQKCHPTQHDWWSGHAHSRAMRTLRAKGSGDPACVKCHATAERSGPVPASLDSYQILESVGCESCHGPGEAHVASGGGVDTIEGLGDDCPVCVIEAVCTSCHTPEWDPDWELEARLDAIAH